MRRSLEYIEGYLALGLVEEARVEWETIPSAQRSEPAAVDAHLAILYAAQAWPELETCSRRQAVATPTRIQPWISLAFALRRTQGLPAAITVLERLDKAFGPTSGLLHYNLACYYCVGGRTGEAKDRLRNAFRLEPELKKTAAADEDLRQLWPMLSAADGFLQQEDAPGGLIG